MALIYKPNALYMSPKNESIDVTDDITFSFMFKGYQLLSATGQIYQNSNIGEWEAISGATFNFDNANAPYYNNDVLSTTLSSGTAYTSIVNNVNSTLGWGVTVYGVSSTQNASNNILIPAQKGFEMGDMVNVTGAGIPYTFIGSYDSKLSLGAVTSDTTAGDNIFAVSEAVYLNLTTGDKIQAITDTPPYYSNTAYYIRKINEGASEPTGYFIAVYSTQSEAESGTGTRVTSAVANKTFYVNPVPTSSSVFYVGLIGGNKIKLYTSKEAALQSVSEAVVPLTNNSSYTIQAFENSQIVQFTPLIANSIVFDLDDVYGTNRGVTLTLSDNNIYTYSSANTLFTGQQLTATNGTDNKIYYIRVWENNPNTLSLFTNRQAALGNNSTYLTLLDLGYNNIYLSEVLQNNKSFTISWKDLNNIPMIVSWEAILYSVKFDDTNNIKSKNIIEKSGIQYNGNVKYEFEHLLLSFASNLGAKDSSNFGRYMVEFNLVDSTGFEYTGSLLFDVGYEVAFTSYSPSAIVNNCDSSVSVQWDNAVTIKGEAQDGSVGQIKDYLYAGNYGTLINRNNSVTYDVNIPENSFPTFLFQPSAGFNGTIVSLDGETESAVLRYDVIAGNGVFTFSITTKALGSTVNTIVNTDVNLLDNSKVYLIGYAEGEIYIREYADASGALTETSASGTTINIDGTVYHEPLDITLQGNTSQTTYSGKQMYTLTDGTYTVGTITATVSNGIISISGSTSTTAFIDIALNTNISLTNGESYTMALFNPTANANVYLRIVGNGIYDTIADAVNKTQTFIYDSANAYYNDHFTIRVGGGTSLTNFKLQPMLVKGNTAGDYEPYVGGISSPNPSYPQTIHNVSGDNDILVMGKNLISNVDIYNGYAYANDGATLTYISSDKTITYKKSAKVMAGIQYTLSWKPNTPKLTSMRDIKIADDDAKQLQNIQYSNSNNVKSVSFTPTYSGWVYACLDANATEPMLEVGSTATTYEEYKGITYHFPLPVENLWNENTQVFTNQSRFDNPTKDNNNKWTFTSNSSGYAFATSNITLSAGTYTVSATVSNGDFLLQKNGTTITNTFTITEETQITFRVYKSNATSGDIVTLSKVLVERGSKANTYTPYGTTPIELNKIGNYQDYFYKNGNKWYLHKEIGKKYCDGTENWTSFAYGTNSWRLRDFISTTYDANKIQIMSTQFKGVANVGKNDVECMIYTESNVLFTVRNTTYTTKREIQQGMNGQPIYYALRTATNTEITDTTLINQLNNIEKAYSYNGTTNILQDNSGNPFMLEVQSSSYK